jgi:hypothetical protein
MDEKLHSYTTISSLMSEMTLNYWMIVERYPKLNGVVDGLIPNFEIFSLLDQKKNKLVGGYTPPTFRKRKRKDKTSLQILPHEFSRVLVEFKWEALFSPSRSSDKPKQGVTITFVVATPVPFFGTNQITYSQVGWMSTTLSLVIWWPC